MIGLCFGQVCDRQCQRDEIVPSRTVTFIEFKKLEVLNSICRWKAKQDKIKKRD